MLEHSIKLKIKTKALFYFILLLPFIPVEYFVYSFPLIGTFYTYARVFVLVILLFRFFARRRISIPLIFACVLIISGLISAFMANISIYTTIYNSVYLLGITLLVEDGVNNDIKAFIDGTLILFEILTYANLIFYICNPEGYISGYYFFGNKNTVVRKLFPRIVLSALRAYRSKSRLTLRFGTMTLSLLLFLIGSSAITALLGVLVFVIVLVYSFYRKKCGIFRYEYFLMISLVLTFVFAISQNFSIFANFIGSVLGRDMTLSNRTILWSNMPEIISQKWLWGYGQGTEDYIRGIIRYVDPHNIYLGVLFYGGGVALILLFILLIYFGRKIVHWRNNNCFSAFVFNAAFCSIFLMWNFEPYASFKEFYRVYMLFVMIYYLGDVEKFIKSSAKDE